MLLGQVGIAFEKKLRSTDEWLVISVLPLTMNSVVRGFMTMLEAEER